MAAESDRFIDPCYDPEQLEQAEYIIGLIQQGYALEGQEREDYDRTVNELIRDTTFRGKDLRREARRRLEQDAEQTDEPVVSVFFLNPTGAPLTAGDAAAVQERIARVTAMERERRQRASTLGELSIEGETAATLLGWANETFAYVREFYDEHREALLALLAEYGGHDPELALEVLQYLDQIESARRKTDLVFGAKLDAEEAIDNENEAAEQLEQTTSKSRPLPPMSPRKLMQLLDRSGTTRAHGTKHRRFNGKRGMQRGVSIHRRDVSKGELHDILRELGMRIDEMPVRRKGSKSS